MDMDNVFVITYDKLSENIVCLNMYTFEGALNLLKCCHGDILLCSARRGILVRTRIDTAGQTKCFSSILSSVAKAFV